MRIWSRTRGMTAGKPLGSPVVSTPSTGRGSERFVGGKLFGRKRREETLLVKWDLNCRYDGPAQEATDDCVVEAEAAWLSTG